jgi:hypothetical protein
MTQKNAAKYAIVDDVFERRKKFLDYILYTLTILPANFPFLAKRT